MVRENRDICGIKLYVDKFNITAQETYRKLGMDKANYIIMEGKI
jgi:ribosomal protein S18 acetylase RimI-like enzyme